MITQFESIGKAEAVFAEMVQFVRKAIASGELRADEVERSLFDKGLTVGLHLLEAFVASAGDGNHGETVEREGKTLYRSEKIKPKPYRSIFGVITRRALCLHPRLEAKGRMGARRRETGTARRRAIICAGGLVAAGVREGIVPRECRLATRPAGCEDVGSRGRSDVPQRG